MKLQRGQTALITGASGGLGEEFARQLSARGINVVLVARSRDKLEALAAELRTAGITVDVFSADLANPAAVKTLIGDVLVKRAKQIDLLINNAGLGEFGAFGSIPIEKTQQQLSLNIDALVTLSRGFIAPMLERKQGAILNVASTASFQPVPHLAVYAATKAFVLSFSEAVNYECRKSNIQVMALCPGPVATNFAEVAGLTNSALFHNAAAPEKVVGSALRALERGAAVTIPSLSQYLLTLVTRVTPRALVVKIAGSMMGNAVKPG